MINRIESYTDRDFSEESRHILQDSIKHYIGTEYAFTVTSGTVGIMIALKTLMKHYPNKTRVLISNYGHPAAVNCCDYLGLSVVPLKMDMKSLSIDIDYLKQMINGSYLAVINVETNGIVGDIESIKNICEENNASLIEDATPSLLQQYKGKQAGTFGVIGIYSFSPGKGMYSGEGGCVITDDQYLAETIDELYRNTNFHDINGSMNFALSNILCDYLLEQFSHLPSIIDMRERTHSMYKKEGLDIFEYDGVTNRYGSIMYLSDKAAEISTKLSKFHIEHRYKAYPIQSEVGFSNSSKIRNTMIDLPMGFHITQHMILAICRIIKGVEDEL